MPTVGIGIEANRSYIGHSSLDTCDRIQKGDKGVEGHSIGAVIVQHNLSRSQIKKMLVSVIHGCVINHTRPGRRQGRSDIRTPNLRGAHSQDVQSNLDILYK